MTGKEAAERLRRLADAIESFEYVPKIKRDVLNEDCQLGAAAMVMFLRDLFTDSPKNSFTREEVLVLLNTIQNDKEIFTADLVTLMEEE